MFYWLLNSLSSCLHWLSAQPDNEPKTHAAILQFLPPSDPYADDLPVGPIDTNPHASASDALTASPVNPSTPDPIAQNLTNLTEIPFEKRNSTTGKPAQYVSAPYPEEELTRLTKRFPEIRFSVVQSRQDPSQHRLVIRENKIDQNAIRLAPR